MLRVVPVVLCWLAASAVASAAAQRNLTLPGTWPLTGVTGQAATAAPPPLPNRRIEIPVIEQPRLVPGAEVRAGYMFEGQDPTIRPDADGKRQKDRIIPREANDQPRAVPGVTVTVPIGR